MRIVWVAPIMLYLYIPGLFGQETAELRARIRVMEERIRSLEAEIQRLKAEPQAKSEAITVSAAPQEKSAEPLRSSPSKRSDEAQFRALIDQCFAARDSLSPDNAARFYARDRGLVFYDFAPLKDSLASRKTAAHDDLRAVRRGKIAWTTVTLHLAAKLKDGRAIETDGRHTAIWEKRGGQWLIVHDHWSAPMSAP